MIDGRIGAGKSSIVEAITWCLYGIARVDNRNIIKNGEASAEVQLILKDNVSTRISRKITASGKHTLTIHTSDDGEDWTALPITGIKLIQEWIETELLHASYQLFINSISYPQSQTESFVNQTANKRKDLLLEIAGIANYEDLYKRAHKLIETKEEDFGRITGAISINESTIKMAENAASEILELQKNLKTLEDEKCSIELVLATLKDKKDKLLASYASLQKVKREKEEAQLRLTTTENEIKRINERIATIKQIDVSKADECEKKLSSCKSELMVLEMHEATVSDFDKRFVELSRTKPHEYDYEKDIASLNLRIKELEAFPDAKCQKCGEPIPSISEKVEIQKASLVHELTEKMKLRDALAFDTEAYSIKVKELGMRPESKATNILSLKALIASLETEMKSYDAARAALATIDELNATISVQNALVEKYQKELLLTDIEEKNAEKVYESLRNVDEVEQDIKLNARMAQIDPLIREMTNSIVEKGLRIKMAEEAVKTIEELRKEESVAKVDIDCLKATKEMFGGKGIKTLIVDTFAPKLERDVNEILSLLSDFRVEINTLRDTADGDGTVEGLYIDVIDSQGNKREFSAYSGGERLAVMISISEALANLQNTCSFRVFDESFIGLDSESEERFVSVINKLGTRFSQMLVISHIQSIKDVFTDRIEVVNRGGDSTIDSL